MTNQSVITLFIILSLMSATLFFNQIEKLNQIEAQPSINLTQIRDSINRFEGAAANYQKAVEVKKGSDFIRGALDVLLSPFSSIINLFLDSVTDIENEADQSIQQASIVIYQYKNIVKQLNKTRQQQVSQMITWRNIGFIFCLFSLSSALFARLPKTTKTQELVLTKETSIKNVFLCTVAGGLVSCLPYYSSLITQLVLPALLIAYFIDYKHTQNQQNTWQKRILKTIAFSLVFFTVIYGFYTEQRIMTGYAVSGFLFGLFVASVLQQTQISLTTRQFFLIAFIFSIARLIAAFSAAESGAELIILEGLLGIIGTLWVIQTHDSWVQLVRFDILLSWFAIYSITAFIFGNYFQTEIEYTLLSNLVLSVSGGMVIMYHLSRTRTELNTLFYLSNPARAKELQEYCEPEA